MYNLSFITQTHRGLDWPTVVAGGVIGIQACCRQGVKWASLSGTLGGLELTMEKVGFLGDHSSPGSEVAMLGALLLLLP